MCNQTLDVIMNIMDFYSVDLKNVLLLKLGIHYLKSTYSDIFETSNFFLVIVLTYVAFNDIQVIQTSGLELTTFNYRINVRYKNNLQSLK